jgi:CheY-like chemotaxis protein
VTRVLVFDRNSEHRRMLVGILETAGFTASAAGAPAEALAAAGRADAVLIDVSSVGRQAAGELHHLLRTDVRTARLPVLAIGWQTTGWDLGSWASSGASYYLARPFTTAALVSRLNHLIVHAAITAAALAGVADVTAGPRPGRVGGQSVGRTTTFSPVRATAAAKAGPVSASG